MDNATAQEETTRCRSAITEQAFRAMPVDDLIRCMDAIAHTGGGHKRETAHYRNELTRREAMYQNQRLEDLTRALVVLTRRLHRLTEWIVVLTVILVALELGPRIIGAGH